MVTVAALRFEIDGRGLKEGAEQVERSLDGVKRATLDATGAHDNYEKRMRTTSDATRGYSAATSDATTRAEQFNRSLFSMEGIGERIGQKLNLIAKASIGIFAVDIVAKAVGFSSALDAVGKAADYAGDKLRDAFAPDAPAAKNIESLAKRLEDLQGKLNAQTIAVEFNGSTWREQVNVGGPREEFQATAIYKRLQDRLSKLEADNEFVLKQPDSLELYQAAKERIVGQRDALIEKAVADVDRIAQAYKNAEKAARDAKIEAVASLAAMASFDANLAKNAGLNAQDRFFSPFVALQEFQIRGSMGSQLDNYRRGMAADQYDARHPQGAGRYPSAGEDSDFPIGAFNRPNLLQEALKRQEDNAKSQDRLNRILNDGVENTERLALAARGMGEAFSNGFEDAVLGAKSLGEATRSLGYEIERILMRQIVTNPLSNMLSGLFAGAAGVKPAAAYGGNAGLGGSQYLVPGDAGYHALGGTLWGPHIAFPMYGGQPKILGESGPEDVVSSTSRGRRSGGGVTLVQNFYGAQNGDTMQRSRKQTITDLKRMGLG